jgi:tetraprenyl-beta-curcumene synthase
VRAWRARAAEIPDPQVRHDALSSLARKRGHTDGAALFWILPRARSLSLLRLLVAYEIMWDFLDGVNEHGATAGQTNGLQLHLALIEALDPNRPISDHYRHHPWRDDGGYLRALVEVCRQGCTQLPSYERVRPLLVREAVRAQVLGINHDLAPARRDETLREWAAKERSEKLGVDWFELTGAASASLTVHALLALGAEPACTDRDIGQIHSAYSPWISAATTMLDSYVDQSEDAANGDHSYIAHYHTPRFAAQRIRELIQRGLLEAGALPSGERHTLIVACMVAMYLSKDSARTQAMRETTKSLMSAGGSLTRVLLPILRLWRIAYAQRFT